MINFDKFLVSFINEMKKYQPVTCYNFPGCVKKALEDQGLAYKDGEIIKTQRRISAEAKENGYGESENDKVKKEILEVAKTVVLRDGTLYGKKYNCREWITWLEKQDENKEEINEASYRTGIKRVLDNPESYGLKKQSEQKPIVIIPKFRVGDEIITENEESLTITRIDEEGYWSNDLFICDFDSECVWDLVEQKPTEWSKEDKERYISCLQRLGTGNPDQPETINSKWFKEHVYSQTNITDEELVQARKEAYNEALDKIEYHDDWPTFDDGWNAAIWYLKKRNGRLQSHWKPSNEQMRYLNWIANVKLGSKHLSELYEQLKQL